MLDRTADAYYTLTTHRHVHQSKNSHPARTVATWSIVLGHVGTEKSKGATHLPLSFGVHPRMSILHPGASRAGSWSAGLGQVSRVEHHGHVWDLLVGSGVGQLRAPTVPKLLGLKEKKQSRVSLCAFGQSLDCTSCQVHRAWVRTECSERIT